MKFITDAFVTIRKRNRFTTVALAKELGVTRATVWAWEKGKRVPSETITRKLASILNVDATVISDLPSNRITADKSLEIQIDASLKNLESSSPLAEKAFSNIVNSAKFLTHSLLNSTFTLKVIMDSMHQICYIKDNEGKYIAANKAFFHNLKLDEKYPIKGKTDFDFFSKSEALFHKKLEESILLGNENEVTTENYIPGTRRAKWGILYKRGIQNIESKIEGTISIITDITLRRQEEIGRRLMEEALNISNLALLIYDSTSMNKILYVNECFKRVFDGFQLEPLNKLTEFLKIIHPDDIGIITNIMSKPKNDQMFEFSVFDSHNNIKIIRSRHIRIKNDNEFYFAFLFKNVIEVPLNSSIKNTKI
ncbi:MAG: hypothetical protein A2X47_04755 [Lentisphaerae bacterium GWF2_38_69]|nr:MAG: hypothetical protein A2X47_04755 [Lentisphaerae bacterium GWF2_38_69]